MSAKTYRKGDDNFLKNIKKIARRFKGKGGGPDSETAVSAHKQDLQDGWVWFWSDNSDITNVITRSIGYILEVRDHGETVGMKIDKKGFRSCYHAFKVSKKGAVNA